MSIYDRDYMRKPEGGKSPLSFLKGSPSRILIFANVVAFVIQAFGERAMGRVAFQETFALSLNGLLEGKVWTLVTYAFMHADLLHICCNMLGLFFIGGYVERVFGNRKFCVIYFAGAIFGGLLWSLFSAFSGVPEVLVGASAATMAIFAAFCISYPPMPITFLLFFVIPVSMRPITMLKITALIESLGLVSSLSGGSSVVAYSAHLGGMAAGLVLARLAAFGKLSFIDRFKFPKFSSRRKVHTSRGGNSSDYSFKVNISSAPKTSDEINRILDKISARGFASLTDEEREVLRSARDNLKER